MTQKTYKPVPTNGTILLTGATGYIGSVIAERLIAAGYRVRGLVRSEKSAQKAAVHGIINIK